MKFPAPLMLASITLGSGFVAGIIAGISIGVSKLLKSESYIYVIMAIIYVTLFYVARIVTNNYKKNISRNDADKIVVTFDNYYTSTGFSILSAGMFFFMAILCGNWIVSYFGDIVSNRPIYFSLIVMILGTFYFEKKLFSIRVKKQ